MSTTQPLNSQPTQGTANYNVASNGQGPQSQVSKLGASKQQTSNGGPVTNNTLEPIIVEREVEVVKYRPAQGKAPVQTVVQEVAVVNPLDPQLRNLLAETMSKVALLVMENNRIKYRINEREKELYQLRNNRR
jgi:hypothetical protein